MTDRFVPPKTRQARGWVRSTGALRKHLRERLESANERARAKRREADSIEKEAESIEQALRLLDQLLPPKEAKQAALSDGSNGTADQPAIAKRWSLMWDACRHCNRTSVRHMARGLCGTCYTDPAIRQLRGVEAVPA